MFLKDLRSLKKIKRLIKTKRLLIKIFIKKDLLNII